MCLWECGLWAGWLVRPWGLRYFGEGCVLSRGLSAVGFRAYCVVMTADVWTLTAREAEVCRLMGVECLSSKLIARRLGLSFRTVECHRSHVLEKMGVHSTAELARLLALRECRGAGI
jgi:DNA-binding CsgD family transcriptional regulator